MHVFKIQGSEISINEKWLFHDEASKKLDPNYDSLAIMYKDNILCIDSGIQGDVRRV